MMLSQRTLDETIVKPLTGAVWVAIVFVLLEGLPKNLRRIILLGFVVGATVYLDRRVYADAD